MLDLAEIPFFDALPAESLQRLQATIPVRHYAQGSAIVRVGDAGRYFQAIAEGAVWVQQNDRFGRKSGVFLGPGQVFGEMSLFSGMPVSATLIATKDTTTYCFDGNDFLNLLEAEPLLHKSLTRLLIERLRKRTRYDGHTPGLVILAYESESIHAQRFVEIITQGIVHHSPGSEILSASNDGTSDATNPALRSVLVRWRENAPSGQQIILKIRPGELSLLSDDLEPKDVVLHVLDVTDGYSASSDLHDRTGVADFACVYIGIRKSQDPNPWSYQVAPKELERVSSNPKRWDATAASVLDKIARYLTFKEVGIVMSSGAARGFAHLGVLEAMADRGIVFDVLCGSSMGGIVALTVARKGNIHDAVEQVRQQLGANKKVRDPSLLPRGSLFAGNKVAAAANATFGDCTFADLTLPTLVVAADLAGRERVIFDRGPVAPAVLATSAIPGFFPPIASDTRLMVDGGVVSAVPVDVLDSRRCGLRIAINVLPLPQASDHDVVTGFDGLVQKMRKPLGLKSVLGASWELLGSWASSNEALKAEIVITPQTPAKAGYDFDQFEVLVECGRVAARERADAIFESVKSMLGP